MSGITGRQLASRCHTVPKDAFKIIYKVPIHYTKAVAKCSESFNQTTTTALAFRI